LQEMPGMNKDSSMPPIHEHDSEIV
jgi:hypothetical protein